MQISPWVTLGLAFAAIALLANWAGRTTRRWAVADRLGGASLRAEPLLVNPSERAAWNFLTNAEIGQAHILAKVRLEDVVSVNTADHRLRNSVRGQIKSRHLDFLLTDGDFRPLLAVEVDGSSHSSERAATADELKRQVLARAGVPLLRLQVGSDWDQSLAQWQREQAAKAGGGQEVGNGTLRGDGH